MGDGGENLRFAFEEGYGVAVVGECFGDDLDGNATAEARIVRLIHLAHAAGADGVKDLVGSDLRAGG